MKHLFRLIILLLLVGGGWLGWLVAKAQKSQAAGMRHMARQEWAQARTELSRYLRLHPGDETARLMLAEAYARDDSLEPVQAAQSAIDQLQRVADRSGLGAKARVQEARLRFLILNQPVRAEKLFRRAIQLDPDNYDANFMLWKLLD